MSSYTDPGLSYIGSIEPTNVTGANLFQIIFDSSLSTPFMFEYIIQSNNVRASPNTIVAQDFIYPEAAQTTGIANQWILPVPFTAAYSSLSYNPNQNIMIRVYPENVDPTPWSNALDLYNPPPQPQNIGASFPVTIGPISLNVTIPLPINVNNSPPIQYMTAYYYYSVAASSTQWAVTAPVTPTLDISNVLIASYTGPDCADISGNFYVSISGVFPIPGTSPIAYTVSMISATVVAVPSTPSPPTLDSVTYNVYTQPNRSNSGPNTMTVNWTAPPGTPGSFRVTDYIVDVSANAESAASYTVVSSNTTFTIPDTLLNNYLDMPAYNIEISVIAIINGIGYRSNVLTKKIFQFSPAPSVINVYTTIPTSNTQNISFDVTTPTSFGVYNVVYSLNWIVYYNSTDPYPLDGLTIVSSGQLSTTPTTSTTYNFNAVGVSYSSSNQYSVAAWITTQDTNSSDYLAGLYGQGSSVAFTLNAVNYLVYDDIFPTSPGPQEMVLTWGTPNPPPLNGYRVYVNGNNTASTISNTYTYSVPAGSQITNNTFTFYIAAVNGGIENNSNSVTENVFVYASAPVTRFEWASNSVALMEVLFSVQLQNLPTSLGVNDGVGSLGWQIYHNYPYGTTTPTVDVTGTVSYTDLSNGQPFTVFADCSFSSTYDYGLITYMTTRDTNRTGAYLSGISSDNSFVASDVPIFYDVSWNSVGGNIITSNISSMTALKNKLFWVLEDMSHNLYEPAYSGANLTYIGATTTTTSEGGIMTTITVLRVGNGTSDSWEYSLNISTPIAWDDFILQASNNVGMGKWEYKNHA